MEIKKKLHRTIEFISLFAYDLLLFLGVIIVNIGLFVVLGLGLGLVSLGISLIIISSIGLSERFIKMKER